MSFSDTDERFPIICSGIYRRIVPASALGLLWVGGAGMPADQSTGKTVMYTAPLLYCCCCVALAMSRCVR